MMKRRSFLIGLGSLMAAPMIVQASSLMKIKEYAPAVPDWCPNGWLPLDGREVSKKWYPDLAASYEKMGHPLKIPVSPSEVAFQTYHPIDGIYRRGHTIISYRDFKRPNGSIMRAGATHQLMIPIDHVSV